MSALPVFDVDEVAVVTKDGLHKNTPVIIKKQSSTYKTPYSKSKEIFYDCETTDDPPRIIVVNEKDLISFDQYLDDMNIFDMSKEESYKALEDFLPDLHLDFDLDIKEIEETKDSKICECGAEKTNVGNHSTWCPKYV